MSAGAKRTAGERFGDAEADRDVLPRTGLSGEVPQGSRQTEIALMTAGGVAACRGRRNASFHADGLWHGPRRGRAVADSAGHDFAPDYMADSFRARDPRLLRSTNRPRADAVEVRGSLLVGRTARATLRHALALGIAGSRLLASDQLPRTRGRARALSLRPLDMVAVCEPLTSPPRIAAASRDRTIGRAP